MQPKPPSDTRPQPDLFRSRLENMLNRRHPLYRLANKIDWGFFEKEFGLLYVEKVGPPGINGILAGCGFNLRKLPRSFFAYISGWLFLHRSGEDADYPGRLMTPVAARNGFIRDD